jgi:hypothetical protein
LQSLAFGFRGGRKKLIGAPACVILYTVRRIRKNKRDTLYVVFIGSEDAYCGLMGCYTLHSAVLLPAF